MMENYECITCKKEGPDVHLCNPEEQMKQFDCPYCGAKSVTNRHMCKDKVSNLTHVCLNCGRVSDQPDNLCYPVALNEVTKAKWKSIPSRTSELLTCVNCEQPIESPGHICDPLLPYECKYCGQTVVKTHHLCKEIIDQARFACKLCGRLAVDESEVCTAWELK
ncbi:MAG TPA: hypothetical protein VKM55_05800 [Candidatus Lokiarchaeia archaeon]|nr:hypothetical protein [Candidatus Lokiarchaeia archaeon]